ncbi:MAG TPA: RagB/SusD family nutrient uptake outer membrane protein [Petrimonas sp.]|nr:RagB/SusD family nutrient uptake outer membrane protein [Petrimonas sp.]
MKIKNNIVKIIIFALFGAPFIASCVDHFNIGDAFLEKAPGVTVNADTIFSKAEYARAYLWEAYGKLYTPHNSNLEYYIMGDCPVDALSDCIHSRLGWGDMKELWYPGNYNASWSSGWDRSRMEFTKIWGPIRNCWNFIENVDRVGDMSEDEKERLKAEAKIIISILYYTLFRHVGGLPIIDHAYLPTEEYNAPRATIEETVDFMVHLLDEAAATPSLPFSIPESEKSQWAGRMTKGAALGFKAKVLLFAASPLFNDASPYSREEPQDAVDSLHVWYGGYKPELWNRCLDACNDFFSQNASNGNPYQLLQPKSNTEEGYMAVYRQAYWTRGNSEKIIEVHTRPYVDEWGDQQPINVMHQGAYCPTVEFMEMFPMADGRNFKDMSVYNTDNPTNIDIFENRDPRMYETLLTPKKGRRWQNYNQIEVWEEGNLKDAMGWYYSSMMANGIGPYKWCLDFYNLGVDPVQYSILRMGEMHLIYAEALAETGNLQKACEEVNKVRARVGLGKIEEMNPELNLTSNKENLIHEILRERAVELGFEEHRFLDICRRKMADKFTTPLHGIKIYRKDGKGKLEEGEPYPTEFRYETYVFTDGARAWWKPGFFTTKWYLQALPIPEINKGYGLTQNPGW